MAFVRGRSGRVFRLAVLAIALATVATLFLVSLLPSAPTVDDPQISQAPSHVRRDILQDLHVQGSEQGDEVSTPSDSAAAKPPEEHESETKDNHTTLAVPDCAGPWDGYPKCKEKMEWMAGNWQIDKCYAELGVDGSQCSLQVYLSEIEKWCPPVQHYSSSSNRTARVKLKDRAVINYSVEPLVRLLSENGKFDWIRRRISSSWSKWEEALKALEKQKPFQHARKKLFFHIGALSDKGRIKLNEMADSGGPLGELVQWSDLISAVHALGHELVFSTEVKQIKTHFGSLKKAELCPTDTEKQFDVIFTDIVGVRQFKSASRIQHYQCLFRVLDSFGTEPVFNFKRWKPPSIRGGELGQTWANLELNPRQFMTMYPHTPDNSFLGFVVGSSRHSNHTVAKRNQSLVYGKELYMWQEKHKLIDVISRYVDVHATIGFTQVPEEEIEMTTLVPGFVQNHGILNSSQLQALLQETKVFIGLGFPFEGPAPLEAIALGCFFVNPIMDPPLSRANSEFFSKKPTTRAITSQNPYAEMFIGKPYVYNVNISNLTEVMATLQHLVTQPTPPPYLPYEYTYEGMLERVAVYVEHQEFCSRQQWPPLSELRRHVSSQGESCKDTCYRHGLVCEPEFFPQLNSEEALKSSGLQCLRTREGNSAHGPSYSPSSRECHVQVEPLLLSCAGAGQAAERLCPCRTYRRGQIALCSSCTR